MISAALPNLAITDFQLGEFRISPNRHIVAEGCRETKVPPKVMAVLIALANQAPKVVTRESLIEGLWEGNAYVGQRAVTDAIWRLRRIFGGTAGENPLIETIPKRGYRLTEPPQPCGDPTAEQGSAANPLPARHHGKTRAGLLAFALAIVVATLAWLTTSGPSSPKSKAVLPDPLPPQPMTHYPGRESAPNLSPDGRRLAFIWERQPGSGTVYLLNLASPHPKPRQLGMTGAMESMPAWSPDGQRLAVIRRQGMPGQIAILTLATEQWQVLPTTQVHPLSGLSWQSDGRSLLYTASNGDSGGFLAKWSFETSREIPLSQANGKVIPIGAKFGPTGDTIALIQRNLTNFVHDLVLVDNGQWQNLSHGDWDTLHFQWSPQGDGLLLTTYQNPHTLLRWRRDHPALQPIASLASLDLSDFALGPDASLYAARSDTRGRLRAFSKGEDHPWDFTTSLGSDHSPDWSEARNQMVFISNRGGNVQLWAADARGQNANCLTNFPDLLWQPSWSPNGQAIAFVGWTAATDHHDLYLLELEQGEVRQVTGDDYHYMGIPSWSADGNSVYMGRMKESVWHLCRIEVASKRVTALPIEAFFAQETKDGASLYYCRNGKKGLWRRDWESGEEVQVLDVAILESQWVLTSKHLYLIIDGPNSLQLAEYDLGTQTLALRQTLPKEFLWHNRLTYIPATERFVYGGLASNERDIFKVDLTSQLAVKPAH